LVMITFTRNNHFALADIGKWESLGNITAERVVKESIHETSGGHSMRELLQVLQNKILYMKRLVATACVNCCWCCKIKFYT
jgi:hypothetical protein